jgi:hypothetical protein
VTQDFESFITYLKSIKSRYNPSIFKNDDSNENIEKIKKEGKLSFTSDNITNLLCFSEKIPKKVNISINSYFIETKLIEKPVNFYTSKAIFSGKHCFEITIINNYKLELGIGLVHIAHIGIYKKSTKNLGFSELKGLSENSKGIFSFFKIEEPLLIQNQKGKFNHFIFPHDVLGCCFDLDKLMFYLFLNGEIVNIYKLNINRIDDNDAFVPIISLGNHMDIYFNSWNDVQFQKEYEKYGFVPLDDFTNNNLQLSNLINVSQEYLNILFHNGYLIIKNSNLTNSNEGKSDISYSDINQIFHIIFDFIGKVAFKHSYIIKYVFISSIYGQLNSNPKSNNEILEVIFICLKYILNYSTNKTTLVKNIFLNLAETIRYNIRFKYYEDESSLKALIDIFTFFFNKKEIRDILIKLPKTLNQIFNLIFISYDFSGDAFKANDLDFIIQNNLNEDNNIINNKHNIISKSNSNEHNQTANITEQSFLGKIINEEYYNFKNNDFSLFYKELVNSIVSTGIDNSESNEIYKKFKKYFEKEVDKIERYTYIRRNDIIINLFKCIFIPSMEHFNKNYQQIKTELSIKKYLSKNEVDGEKLGGTIKYLFEEHRKNTPDFEKYEKKNLTFSDNVFLLEFINFFFIRNNCLQVWRVLFFLIESNSEYLGIKLWELMKKNLLKKLMVYF